MNLTALQPRSMRSVSRGVRALFFSLLVVGSVSKAHAQEISDPIEPVNRKIFWFNDQVDTYLLEPVSDGYREIMPKQGRKAVERFFSNLGYPRQLVSNVVQGKVSRAGIDTARFLINSTLGLAGFFDVASDMGLERQDEDFGQALGYLGVGTGAYVVLPFFGPSNVRDAVGRAVDAVLDPFYWVQQGDARAGITDPIIYGSKGVDVVNTRAELKDAVDTSEESSVDRYLFVQGAYTQHRLGKVWDNEPPEDPTEESPWSYFNRQEPSTAADSK